MTNQSRQPKGIPTGGQFAASAHSEAEGIDLEPEVTGDYNAATGESYLDVYGNRDECRSIGAHMTACDDDGYCVHCGEMNDDEDEDCDEGSVPLLDFQVPGSSSTFEVRVIPGNDYEGEERDPEFELYRDGTYIGSLDYTGDPSAHDEIEAAAIASLPGSAPSIPAERPCFGCGHQHDPNSSGPCYEATCLPGCSGCHEQDTIEARDKAIAKILDPDAREACGEYANRYALPPRTLDHEIRWTSMTRESKPARDLAVGDRLPSGRVVTSIEQRNGVVWAYCDGQRGGQADAFFNHGDPVTVHEDRVDLSDPDWFEVEAHRIATGRITDEEIETGAMSDDRRAEITTEVRRTLARVTQPTNISPNFHDGPNADPRIADGRAKVGDNATFSQPMYGDSSYEVIGKRAAQTILGHDGTGVQWGENGDVEYVLRDIATGHQTTSNLRGAGWKRIPAPGDHGPAAQRTALR